MKIKLKHITAGIALVSLGLIIYGFSLDEGAAEKADKFIGIGTVGLFLVAMPLFLIKESKNKRMADYMLNEENIRKMREKKDEKPENQ